MNRKETLGRLLLTLLTAFVMVGAAFVTATSSFIDEATPSELVSVRELDEENRMAGEAPASAQDIEAGTASFATNAAETNPEKDFMNPSAEPYLSEKEMEELRAAGPDRSIREEVAQPADEYMEVDHGSRAPVVDAGGPYGTQAAPLYEGNPVNFVANVVGDANSNYKFRWDVDNDGEYEGPGSAPDYFGAYGDNDLNYQFNDNNIGLAKVEAWDGVSYNPVTYSSRIWDEPTGPGVYYYTGYSYRTFGLRFQVHTTTTIEEIGYYRHYSTRPYWFYNCRIWTDTGGLIHSTNLYSSDQPGTYSWNYKSISPVTLTPGIYRASVYVRGYAYYGDDDPGITPDGVIEPVDWRHGYSNSFPSYYISSSVMPWIDLQYGYTVMEPDVGVDTAEVFVDNVAPIPINPMSVSSGPFYEGSDVGFTGWLMDPGTDDDWEYRWDWGDGTMSNWRKVNKYSGGAKVLLYHSVAGYETELYNSLAAEFGENAPVFDMWSFYDDPGTLDMLLQYDVIIMPENTGIIGGWPPDVGDLIADYVDAGGAVVDLVATFYNAGTWGITGRWADEEYSCFTPGFIGGSSTTSALYWGNEPGPAGLGILDGIAGTVSSWGTSIPISTYGVRSDATILANYPFYRAAAYKHAGAMGPGSGRIVSLNIFCIEGYRTGDALKVIANAAFWASGQAPPTPLPMPIQLDTTYHTFVDDHPTHVTKHDVFDVTLEIRDDDHLKEVMVGNPTQMLAEDFEGVGYSWPPGWYEGGIGGWQMHMAYELNGMAPYLPYYYYGVSILYSPVMDFTGVGGAILDWDNFWSSGWPGGSQDGYVQFSIDYGATWNTVQEFHSNDPTYEVAHYQRTFGAAANEPWVQLRFWCDMYNDWYWEVDNIDIWAAAMYTMTGLGSAATTVDINNVEPIAVVPPELYGKVVDEIITIDFAGMEIYDAAMDELTEEYWYNLDFDDGTETGWIYKGTLGKPSFNILLATTWSGIQGDVQTLMANELSDYEPTIDIYNWYTAGSPPDLTLMQQYDVVLVGTNYIPSSGLAASMGDRLYEYCQGGGNVVQMWSSFHTSARITGDWTANDYNAIERGGLHFGTETLDTVYDPGHPIMEGVTEMDAYYKHNSYDANTNAVRLADYSSGKVLAAYTDYNAHPAGNGRIAGLAFFPSSGNYGGDAVTLMGNALKWAAGVTDLNDPVLDTISHIYGDNGVYYADLQIIDDDMDWTWDWGNGGPLVPGPTADISHNIIPISVNNVDPVIQPIGAWAYLDLVIRTTGEPHNDVTMTLWDGGTAVSSVTVYHDGNYKMETMPAVFDMLRINDYSVTVEYENSDPDGANPTWIFEGRFSSGHTKQLKKVFKDDGTVWNIGPDILKTMLRGEDIVFTAGATDWGSDDVVFIWNFGDCTPHGVHLYANVDQGTAIDGISDEATVIFDQLPVREPWFDYMPNTIRSPDVNPVAVRDMITHAFDEDQPYYYYVTLTVLDDDVKDGYPSPYLNGGGYDMEFCEIDLE
jgi:hypothetical protein